MQIISKHKTNRHTFFFIFWARQGLTLILRISNRDRKSGLT